MKTIAITPVARAMAIFLAALAGVAVVAPAQSIASRVARVSNGTVRMSFRVKPGICGSRKKRVGIGAPGFRRKPGR